MLEPDRIAGPPSNPPPQHRQPPASRVLLATVTAIAGSLAADAHRVHRRSHLPRRQRLRALPVLRLRQADRDRRDHRLAAWPIVTRVSSAPRWLFFRLAILVTLVLWLPDLYILYVAHPATGRRPHAHAPGHCPGDLQPARPHGPGPPGPSRGAPGTRRSCSGPLGSSGSGHLIGTGRRGRWDRPAAVPAGSPDRPAAGHGGRRCGHAVRLGRPPGARNIGWRRTRTRPAPSTRPRRPARR